MPERDGLGAALQDLVAVRGVDLLESGDVSSRRRPTAMAPARAIMRAYGAPGAGAVPVPGGCVSERGSHEQAEVPAQPEQDQPLRPS